MKKILLPLLLTITLGSQAQSVTGRLSFQKGQKFEVTTVNTTTIDMMMGESSTRSTTKELMEVKEAGTNGASLESAMKRIQMSISLMGQERNMDSDKPEDLKGQSGEALKSLLNAKQAYTIDAGGTITAVTSAEIKKPEASAMGMFMQQGNGAAVPTVGGPSLFRVLPLRTVSKGDTWTDTASAMGTRTRTAYTVKDITDTEVMVDYSTDGTVETKQDMMGMSMEVKGTIKATGVITLDKATGILKQKTVSGETDSAASFSGQELPIKTKTTGTITVTQL